jgi:hypothetical protein
MKDLIKFAGQPWTANSFITTLQKLLKRLDAMLNATQPSCIVIVLFAQVAEQLVRMAIICELKTPFYHRISSARSKLVASFYDCLLFVNKIRDPESVQMEALVERFYDSVRSAFSRLVDHPCWKRKMGETDVTVGKEKELLMSIWLAGPILPTVDFMQLLCTGYAMDVFKMAFSQAGLRDIMLQYMRDVGLYIAQEGGRPYLVVVFTAFVDTFSSCPNAGGLLAAGYLVPICQIGRAVARLDYIGKWNAQFIAREGENCMDKYWQTLRSLFDAANQIVGVDSKQAFTDYGTHLVKLLSTAGILEQATIGVSGWSIAFFTSTRRLALHMNSSLEFYSVIRVLHPGFITDAAVSRSGLGGQLASLKLAIRGRRHMRHLFVNEAHAICAFPTVCSSYCYTVHPSLKQVC